MDPRSALVSGFLVVALASPPPLASQQTGASPPAASPAPADTLPGPTPRRAPAADSARGAPEGLTLEPLLVTAERSYSAASSREARDLDLRLRPRDSSQELLRLVPGLVIAQHGGGGKAEQIFLRGFDADHGTDVAMSVDGSPVNMVSHGHGQGYADLHFLMPEVVERVEVRKGPYDARDGDFATAGAVVFHTRDRIGSPVAAARYGSFRTARLTGMVPFGGDASRAGGFAAAAVHATRGPFEEPQGYRRFNLFGKFTAPLSRDAELVASASGFGARWDQSGQVPERAVRSGQIGRFGSIDPSEGGSTERYDVNVGLRSRSGDDRHWEVRAFAARYDFRLFSNFTFFLDDAENGDGIEQTDDRHLGGVYGSYGRAAPLLGLAGRWAAGAGTRADFARVGLFHQAERERLDPRVDAGIRQASFFTWAQRDVELSPRVRLQLGARADLFRFAVQDRLGPGETVTPTGSGVRWKGVLSPRASLALQATPSAALFANLGSGFHSNDARDVLGSRHTDEVLPRALGAELGTRHSWRGGSVAAAVWGLELESELVYVGDEGVTEANGRTRRIGVDLEGRVRLASWLWADADLNLARGRYRDLPDGENRIPLAPSRTAAGGLTVRELGAAEGGLRFRYVGRRPASEDGSVTARGYTLWEAFGSWAVGAVRLVAALDNLLDAQWNEAQFATTSRLRSEPGGIGELHFTPGAPRSIQVGVEYRF
ncbi:MAG TPA: TonB-dependent receptor [Longimicrobiaceae bacterium]|nr:TonB-dependent receptor [Longimicrobiaceae bacterium]